jgi:hypothetical protein
MEDIMAVKTKGVDKSARLYGRGVVFDSGAGDFVLNDVIDINASIGGPGKNVVVEAAAASSCTFRINSMNKQYPLYEPARKLGYPAPDLQNETIWMNSEAISYSLTAGQRMVLDDAPTSNLEFTALVGTVTVTVSS